MIVVSAGFNKTHMTTAASEALSRRQLDVAITGAYPTERVMLLARRARLTDRGTVERLLERGEDLSVERLEVLLVPELLCEGALLATRAAGRDRLAPRLCAATWRLYGRMVAQRLSAGANIYHFRAGFGQASIGRARELGMHVLCDHAIAHPSVLEYLVTSRGQWPPRQGGESLRFPTPASPLNRAALADVNRSDSIVVNSEFVKETFLACGWPEDRVHVVYLGIDENFLAAVPRRPRRPVQGPVRLLFAGRFEARKGADVLAEALSLVDEIPWRLLIAGPIDSRARHSGLLRDPRVRAIGTIRRDELAREMARAPVFVFPSYAEGSARVVFEALASGCYVITTPNSGTIVEHGLHGALVAAGDARALADAIIDAAADRERLAEIGNRNAALIRERYRQRRYGDALAELYERILVGSTSNAIAA